MRQSFFPDTRNHNSSFITLVILAVSLMLLDGLTTWGKPLRSSLAMIMYPVELLVDLPVRGFGSLGNALEVRAHLKERNKELAASNRELHQKLIQYESMTYENARLRELLASSKKIPYTTRSARILAVSMDPFQKTVSINAGSNDGITKGTAILDSRGIMGQITRVYPGYSIGLLITDSNHAIPVQVLRSGVRTIATGSTSTGKLQLQYLPPNSDIKVGDLVVTSGLGLLFPPDFPVATVEKISHKAGRLFATIEARPIAKLETSREVLLILNSRNGEGHIVSDHE